MYSTVKAGLIATLQAGLPGLAVVGYVPSAIAPPVLCVLLDRSPRGQGGQVTSMRYRFNCRLYIKWQEFEQAELELDQYVNAIPAAVDKDPYLAATINEGRATGIESVAHWLDVGGTVYRVLDTFVEALDKAGYGSGI